MNDHTISIRIEDIEGKQFEFNTLKNFYYFIKEECKAWQDAYNKPTLTGTRAECTQILSTLSPIVIEIERWTEEARNWDASTTQYNVHNLMHRYSGTFKTQWVYSKSILFTQLLDCQEKFGGEAANAFIAYTQRNNLLNPSIYHNFIGIMYAYEISNQDSEILKRRNSEKKSFYNLRNDLENSRNELIESVELFKKATDEWKESTQSDWNEWYKSTGEQWNNWITSVNEYCESDTSERREKFISFMDSCKIRIEDLENTYKDKLKLEKPAEYWNKAAAKYKIQGRWWISSLILLGLLGMMMLYFFFTSWLQGKEMGIHLNSVQGIAIYGSFLAVFAFLIRALSKLTFSSFHLMRDAEEREQLTYLYLSLSKEHTVDESSRSIILQALFSRSETGLLTNESGPTMPGLNEAIKSATNR